jgi:hypothetical protein
MRSYPVRPRYGVREKRPDYSGEAGWYQVIDTGKA